MPIRLLATLLLLFAVALSARAETVYVKGREKPLEGAIKSEDAKNVVVTVGKKVETIPSADVIDIVYDVSSPAELGLKGGAFRIAKDAEKDSNTEDNEKKQKNLKIAISNYNETLKKMTKTTAAQKHAARQLEFKIAVLGLRQGTDQTTIDLGIDRLQKFVKAHRDSWQINQALPLIAQLQMDSRDFKEATKTFQEMADMAEFSTDMRREAKLMVVTVAVRSGDIDLANKKLDDLDAEAKANPAFAGRVKMARAEVFIGLKQIDKAMPLLHEVIKTSTDKQSLAIAHNTIGESLFNGKKFAEARWEFLWVDTIYNQDKAQHARALYFLWKTFEQLNEADRAQQCRETLISDRFAGTEYHKRALAEVK